MIKVKSYKKKNKTGKVSNVKKHTRNLSKKNKIKKPLPIKQPFNKQMEKLFKYASRLQKLVPDAVMVGGSAVSYYTNHRQSYDHDHILHNLNERFDIVLEALESEKDFVFNLSKPGKLILGQIGDIEVGVRQLIRKKPLEVQKVKLINGDKLTIPTEDEITRIKAFLIVKRNKVRDYLDIVSMSDTYGILHTVKVLNKIDKYYTDDNIKDNPVATELVRRLSNPAPKDTKQIKKLQNYKNTIDKYRSWSYIVKVCKDIANKMLSN